MAKRSLLTSVVIVLLTAGSAWGNPIVRRHTFGFVDPPALAILVVEALLAAILLYRLGFRPLRVFFAWLAITLITFMLFVKFLIITEDYSFIARGVIGEIWIVILEGLALYILCFSPFFYRCRSDSLEAGQALRVSAIANLASLGMGFLVVAFYAWFLVLILGVGSAT